MAPASQHEYIRLTDAANLLQCSPDTVRREIARGNLPAKRFGRAILIDRRDLERALKPVTSISRSAGVGGGRVD